MLAVAGCGGSAKARSHPRAKPAPAATEPAKPKPATELPGLAGMPPRLDANDVYAADRPGKLSPVVAQDPSLIYVPNSESDSVDVIDPRTFKIIRHFPVGRLPQHVVPSWDMKTLWVTNDLSDSLTAIDPRTGKPGRTVEAEDPYNMYFTPDGKHAIVVAERFQRLDFRDPQTMKLQHQLQVKCEGIDHIDYTADGTKLLASCEFSGKLAVVDVASEHLLGTITLPGVSGTRMMRMPGAGRLVRAHDGGGGPDGMGMPQDVKLAPDGRTFYVADMESNGIWLIDAATWRVRSFLHTGAGAHGLYVSRDSKVLYVSNRGEGSVSLVGADSGKLLRTWRIPGGGSPDMGGVSADGKVLWLSGRYNAEVYAISTADGHLIKRIPVGKGPHGLSVFPQPGRYSLGHTGVFR
jgi:YVTN family beta-propeller protein